MRTLKSYTFSRPFAMVRRNCTHSMLIALAFAALTACGTATDEALDHGTTHEDVDHASTDHPAALAEFELTAEQFASLGISFTRPKFMAMEGGIRLSGKVMSSPLSKAEVTSPLAAKVIDVLVDEGAPVKKGQALITLGDMAFFQMQESYLTARAKRGLAQSELDRQRTLVEADAVASKVLERVQAESAEWNAVAASMEGQLRMLGMDPERLVKDGPQASFTIRSPIEGRVNGISIFIGSRVEPSTVLLEVIDLHHFHVHLNAYERDLALLREGSIFPFEVLNMPGRSFVGELFAIGRRFDADGRSIPVHAHVEQGSEDLVEGMSVTAMIPTGGLQQFAVPEKAVAQSGEEGFVYVDLGLGPNGERRFRQVSVVPGITLNGYTAIGNVATLDTNTMIAADGAFYLRNTMLAPDHDH